MSSPSPGGLELTGARTGRTTWEPLYGHVQGFRNIVALLAQSQSIHLCSIVMQNGFWGKLPTALQNVLGRDRLQSLVRTLCVVEFSAVGQDTLPNYGEFP